jgi:hypothetical protein
MAENAQTCIGCGHRLDESKWMTINGDSYHYDCWGRRGKPVPRARPETSTVQVPPSGGQATAS